MDEIAPELRAQIVALEPLPLSELYARVARESGILGFGGSEEELGEAEVDSLLDSIRHQVCSIPALRRYCQDAAALDTTTVACLVAGGLTASATAGINVALVACILARLGIRSLCAGVWSGADI